MQSHPSGNNVNHDDQQSNVVTGPCIISRLLAVVDQAFIVHPLRLYPIPSQPYHHFHLSPTPPLLLVLLSLSQEHYLAVQTRSLQSALAAAAVVAMVVMEREQVVQSAVMVVVECNKIKGQGDNQTVPHLQSNETTSVAHNNAKKQHVVKPATQDKTCQHTLHTHKHNQNTTLNHNQPQNL